MKRDIAIKRFVPIEDTEAEIAYQRACIEKTLKEKSLNVLLADRIVVTKEERKGIMIESRINDVEV